MDTGDRIQGHVRALRGGAGLAGIPEGLSSWHPAPVQWCVRELIGHLIEAEQRGFAGRVRTMLEHEQSELVPRDQEAVAASRRDRARYPGQLLDASDRLRRAGVALVAGLSQRDLARGGRHPQVGIVEVGDVLHEWVYHDAVHTRQVLANVTALVWPHPGNMQRFHQP